MTAFSSKYRLARDRMTLIDRVLGFSFTLFALLCVLGGIGIAVLYSAGGGSMSPWAQPHLIRLCAGLAGLILVALLPLRLWLKTAYLIYGAVFLLLIVVEVKGAIGMGAQRWIDLGVIRLQPSELMKVALVLALARYYHRRPPEVTTRPLQLLLPVMMILLPTALVIKQPDLGTALMLTAVGGIVMFLAGVRMWLFMLVAGGVAAIIPIAWQFILRDYQKQRVLTFLNPETDPLGAGYHVTQSKIAFGAGGLTGRGYLQGTQSRLNFLPEKQTDFVFTLWAEEFGLIGSLGILSIVTAIFVLGGMIALQCRAGFSRLLVMGLTANFLLYALINMGMVMGLLPVVGVPLPLVSYGGTAMLTTLFAFGLIQCAHIWREHRFGPRLG